MKTQDKFEIKKFKNYIFAVVLQILTTAISIGIFAAVMLFLQTDSSIAVIFATISVAAGCFVSSFYLARKIKAKGYIIGALTGLITFSVVTLVSLMIDKSGVSVNTLFHLIIFMLSSLSGGIMGVNKAANKKYI